MIDLTKKRYPLDSEAHIQNLVINNKDVQQYIVNNLNYSADTKIKFSKCKPYLNRIIPDIKITMGNEIIALMECKGSKINVTDYVRGIGQIFQYEYFSEQSAIEKNKDQLKYSKNFQTIYLIPSDVTINNDFNISKFKYPKTSKVLQINPKNYTVRNFSEEQRGKFQNLSENLIAISEYYFRDNRIYELFILMHHLEKFHKNISKNLNRKKLELDELRAYETINNRNWRNAFITLSGLGFITERNNLSLAGQKFLEYSYYEFLYIIFYDYIEPYAREILPYIFIDPNIKLSDLNNLIRKKNNRRDLLFLTESENRYLSSWLGIFRDDYGILSYESRKTSRTINYNPFKLKKDEFIKMIKKFAKPHHALREFINE